MNAKWDHIIINVVTCASVISCQTVSTGLLSGVLIYLDDKIWDILRAYTTAMVKDKGLNMPRRMRG